MVLGSLVWIGATHYARGVDALEAHAYPQAVSELSAAKVLFVDYRDARALEEQARRALAAEEATRAQEEARVQAVEAQLTEAGQRLAAGDAAGTLAVLQAISPGDLRLALDARRRGAGRE